MTGRLAASQSAGLSDLSHVFLPLSAVRGEKKQVSSSRVASRHLTPSFSPSLPGLVCPPRRIPSGLSPWTSLHFSPTASPSLYIFTRLLIGEAFIFQLQQPLPGFLLMPGCPLTSRISHSPPIPIPLKKKIT